MKASYFGIAIALFVCVSFASAKEMTCWNCDKKDVHECNNQTDVETCDGYCMKKVIESETVGVSAIERTCSETCIGVGALGQGFFCCDNKDLCNTAATTSPFFALSAVACVLAYALNRLV